jgi:hypothetical protein
MQSWHFDATINPPEATRVEVRNQGDPIDPSQIVADAVPWDVTPIEFQWDVTTPGQVREIIFRESSAGNRARLNGFTLFSTVPPPPVIELTLQVNTTTGAVSIRNEQTVSFDMSYYEIRSPSGALSPGGWQSLDDAEGGDPVGSGWDEALASTSNILSEVNLQSMQTFAPGNSMTLGNAFTTSGAQDLMFLYAGPGETMLRTGIIKYVTGPDGNNGDYNNNGTVDAADYVVWRNNLNTTTTLPNDSTPGMVTQEDYNIWRSNFGVTAGSGSGLAQSATVPEPQSLWLCLSAIINLVWFRRQIRSSTGG